MTTRCVIEFENAYGTWKEQYVPPADVAQRWHERWFFDFVSHRRRRFPLPNRLRRVGRCHWVLVILSV